MRRGGQHGVLRTHELSVRKVGSFLIAANVASGAVALGLGEHQTALALFVLATLVCAGEIYARHVRGRIAIQRQIIAWGALTVGVFTIALLMTFGWIQATPLETVLFYVATAGGVAAVIGARHLW